MLEGEGREESSNIEEAKGSRTETDSICATDILRIAGRDFIIRI